MTSLLEPTASDVISGSHGDDETPTPSDPNGIHTQDSCIHSDDGSDTSSEYYSDTEGCRDGDDNECNAVVSEHAPTPVQDRSHLIAPVPVQAKSYLTVSVFHPQLRKLLSDESGYYENFSPDFSASPCDWNQKAVQLTAEDIEEWDDEEWDDEDSTGTVYIIHYPSWYY
jgi:hypothetical protein